MKQRAQAAVEALQRAIALRPNDGDANHLLGDLHERLAAGRMTSTLFDTSRFEGRLEAAYAAMWERHRAGLPPEPLRIAG